MSRLVVVGANGNLGQAVVEAFQKLNCYDVISVTRAELDLTVISEKINKTLDALQPDIIINAAAYTLVDKAEEEAVLANKVNAKAPEYIANWVKKNNKYWVHFSTDYVFDGESRTPYTVELKPNPLNVYGASKLAGEVAALAVAPENTAVFRVSWVFGEHGKNFVPFLVNALQEEKPVKAVVDQIGSPTYTQSVATLLTTQVMLRPVGLFHANNPGQVSRYEQACFIAKIMGFSSDCIMPAQSADFYTQAKRPHNTALVSSFSELPYWEDATVAYLKSLGVIAKQNSLTS